MLTWSGGGGSLVWHLDSSSIPSLGIFFPTTKLRFFVTQGGNVVPNVINFQVPRVGIWPKKS